MINLLINATCCCLGGTIFLCAKIFAFSFLLKQVGLNLKSLHTRCTLQHRRGCWLLYVGQVSCRQVSPSVFSNLMSCICKLFTESHSFCVRKSVELCQWIWMCSGLTCKRNVNWWPGLHVCWTTSNRWWQGRPRDWTLGVLCPCHWSALQGQTPANCSL